MRSPAHARWNANYCRKLRALTRLARIWKNLVRIETELYGPSVLRSSLDPRHYLRIRP